MPNIHPTQLPPLPVRPAAAHKGTFGTVIVVGGSPTMVGAPALCAGAALRAGAGLVKIVAAPGILPFMLSVEPCATGIIHEGDPGVLVEALDRADPKRSAVLAVGPGLGQEAPAGAVVAALLRGPRAMVLDADGLNLLATAGQPRPIPGPPLVLTPHPGEFARLAGALGIQASAIDPAARPEAAAELARAHGAVVVLKGQGTVVSDGPRSYINTTGNPALATAGSGDVLTGCIAALIAQGMAAFEAAVLGVYLHGLAGDLWARDKGPSGLTARDLVELLPEAFAARRKQ